MAINVEVIQNQTTVEVETVGVQGPPGAAGSPGAGITVPYQFRVADYGALGNGKMITDVNVTNGSAVLTSPSGKFSGAAVGQWVMVNTTNGSLRGQITTVTSATQVTINQASDVTNTGLNAVYGTDDTVGIQAAIDAAKIYAEANQYYAEIIFDEAIYITATNYQSSDGASTFNTQLRIPAPTNNNGRKLVLRFKGVGRVDHFHYWNATMDVAGGIKLNDPKLMEAALAATQE